MKKAVFLYLALGLLFGWYALGYLQRYPVGPVAAASIYVCLMALLALLLIPGFPALRFWLSQRLNGPRGGACCFALFLAPYLIYAAGTSDFRWPAFLQLAALSAVPFGLFAAFPVRRLERINWQDAIVLLWLLLPVLFGKIGGVWNVPVNLDFMARLFMEGTGAWSFLIVRKVEGSGYEFHLPLAAAQDALVNFAWYALIALPLGFVLRFIAWNPNWRGPLNFLSDYITIWLFVALAEELFFRGLVQNLLEGSLQSRYKAQGVAAILFGLTHIRHAPFPNWRYVILASVAGWFYGSAYRSRRNLMASSALHALVDTTWRTFLTLPR